jgi:hypothetical protein
MRAKKECREFLFRDILLFMLISFQTIQSDRLFAWNLDVGLDLTPGAFPAQFLLISCSVFRQRFLQLFDGRWFILNLT